MSDLYEGLKADYAAYCAECVAHNVHPLSFTAHWYDDWSHLREQWGEEQP